MSLGWDSTYHILKFKLFVVSLQGGHVHLSEKGNDLFLVDLRWELQAALACLVGALA